jgi:MYXO-CTERM domain-containing protein
MPQFAATTDEEALLLLLLLLLLRRRRRRLLLSPSDMWVCPPAGFNSLKQRWQTQDEEGKPSQNESLRARPRARIFFT